MMRTSAHPNVVEYLESFMFERCLWVTMEFMDGGSLTNLLQVSPPPSLSPSVCKVCASTGEGKGACNGAVCKLWAHSTSTEAKET